MEERILDFLDGRLGGSEEEELLHRLAVSPEHRSLLKQHLRLRDFSASLATRSELTVPPSTTSRLFTALSSRGFSGALPIAGAGTFAQTVAPAANSFSGYKIAGYVGGLVLAFLLGISIFLFRGSASSVSDNSTGSTASDIVVYQPRTLASGYLNEERTIVRYVRTTKAARSASPEASRILTPADQHAVDQMAAQSQRPETAPESTLSTVEIRTPFEGAVPARAISMSDIAHQVHPFVEEEETPSTIPLYFAMRTAAGPSTNWGFKYVNSLSEANITWKPFSWLITRASYGVVHAYETEPVVITSPAGVRMIGTGSSPESVPNWAASFELGVAQTVFGVPMELTAGGFDLGGSVYPRASLFGSILLSKGLNLNLGLEGVLFTHDINSDVIAKVQSQSMSGQTPAILQHTTSETVGFLGPSIELSWQP